MKKTAFAFFIAFWAYGITLLSLSWLAPPGVLAQGESETVYTLAEISRHNQLDDCWMAIEGKVYDFSAYIPMHPTPPQIMAPWCGREATEGMRTKGYGRDHSPVAWQMMEPYQIGVLAAD